MRQSGSWPIFGQILQILAITSEIWVWFLFCPSFRLRLLGKPIFRQIGLILAILCPKNLQKTTKMAVAQNTVFLQSQSPKSLLLLHFLPNRPKIWRCGVKVNFSLNLCFNFLIFFSKIFFRAIFQKKCTFFGKWPEKKFWKKKLKN